MEILIREFKTRSDELFSCSKDIKEFFNISPKQFNTADKFKALTNFIKKYMNFFFLYRNLKISQIWEERRISVKQNLFVYAWLMIEKMIKNRTGNGFKI